MSSTPRSDWRKQPADPDLALDLGYEIEPWDVIPVENGDSEHRVLLPANQEMLKRDAYIIVPSWMVYSVIDHR